MNDLFIQGNAEAKTPTVDFKVSGDLKLHGRSVSENPIEFFEPLILWLKNLKKSHPPKIVLNLQLEYFNTSTSKLLLHMFRTLEEFQKIGSDVKIIWHYDKIDDDLREAGKDYQSIVRIPFEFVEMG
jgi:hypothetical protein